MKGQPIRKSGFGKMTLLAFYLPFGRNAMFIHGHCPLIAAVTLATFACMMSLQEGGMPVAF